MQIGSDSTEIRGKGAHATSRMPKPREPSLAWSKLPVDPLSEPKYTSPPRVASHSLLVGVHPMFCTRLALYSHNKTCLQRSQRQNLQDLMGHAASGRALLCGDSGLSHSVLSKILVARGSLLQRSLSKRSASQNEACHTSVAPVVNLLAPFLRKGYKLQ